MQSYAREDPPPQPKLAVPVLDAHHTYQYVRTAPNLKAEAKRDLINITFYFLLWVGEYTYNCKKRRKRTQTIQSLWHPAMGTKWKINTLHTTKMETTQSSQSNNDNIQPENGTWGQVIHHEEPKNTVMSCIKALVHRIAHIMEHTDNINTPLSAYFTKKHHMATCTQGISTTLSKKAVKDLGYEEFGFKTQILSAVTPSKQEAPWLCTSTALTQTPSRNLANGCQRCS